MAKFIGINRLVNGNIVFHILQKAEGVVRAASFLYVRSVKVHLNPARGADSGSVILGGSGFFWLCGIIGFSHFVGGGCVLCGWWVRR